MKNTKEQTKKKEKMQHPKFTPLESHGPIFMSTETPRTTVQVLVTMAKCFR